MTQGKIERWHQTLKNRILLEHYYVPGEERLCRWGRRDRDPFRTALEIKASSQQCATSNWLPVLSAESGGQGYCFGTTEDFLDGHASR